VSMWLADVYTVPASLAGLPAVAIPSGADAGGMPLSLHLAGAVGEDVLVLDAAFALEKTGRLPKVECGGSLSRSS
jgi:aspartyl-tRNA(Asn)/glutamyl-tRNA(Gln) amidotransferase subunit A